MYMDVKVLEEAGYEWAMLGLSLSFQQDPARMPEVARRLAPKGNGESKFLESIVVWLDIRAPRYWWQQFDTYRVGVTKQSESTMHTITKRPLTQEDFAAPIPKEWLEELNRFIEAKEWRRVKELLPESFIQRRIVYTNYQTLRRIVAQRRDHRLPEWWKFIFQLLQQLEHPEFIAEDYGTLASDLVNRIRAAAIHDVHIKEEV